MESINTLDLIIVAVVGLSAIIGMFRGLVRELLSLAAWIGAGWIALTLYEPARELMNRWIDDPLWAGIVAGAGLFVIVLVALLIIAGFLSRNTKRASMLGPANRMLGVVFGILRGGVVVALVHIATVHVMGLYGSEGEQETDPPKWVETSRLMPHVRAGSAALERLVPKHMRPDAKAKRQDSHHGTKEL
ncbi:CvpA family protein [Emcibacter sp. SYSU 3D8]|uniref:CvpA family protein n=1 Tax=Emcibacter sp. SYSU 3D8 TaxID=3133969 RepID=UPI0031FF3AFF